jgi:formylglycine-generating enzyme required for sulfatase activity
MRITAACIWTIAFLVMGLNTAFAERRIALVIGNAKYNDTTTISSLTGPDNDATAMAKLLTDLGFEVVGGVQINLNRIPLKRAISDFLDEARAADIAVIFYSGHGLRVGGYDYLVPVDAAFLDADYIISDETIIYNSFYQLAERKKPLTLIIFYDACRSEKLFGMPGIIRPPKTAPDVPSGPPALVSTFEGYATRAPGWAGGARDFGGINSPFTQALLNNLGKRNQLLTTVWEKIKSDTLEITKQWQRPDSSVNLDGTPLILTKPAGVAGPSTPAALSETEIAQICMAFANNYSIAVTEELVQKYRGTPRLLSCAEARLKELKDAERKSQTASIQPPKPPAPPVTAVPSRNFKDCTDCPEMVVVPAGSFAMGSNLETINLLHSDRYTHSAVKYKPEKEGPEHSVTIPKAFAVGKFEVTVAQFTSFVRATNYFDSIDSKCAIWSGKQWAIQSNRSWENPGFQQSGSNPVVCVSWDDAKSYVAWLSRTTGKKYRLLTEAEWEYAARAKSTSLYSFGDDESDLCRWGNGADQTLRQSVPSLGHLKFVSCRDGYAYTAPVGSFLANSFGLHDMHGNVSEWTEDCTNENYVGAPDNGSSWISGRCDRHMIRGGSWGTMFPGIRSANRPDQSSNARFDFLGFRVAREL